MLCDLRADEVQEMSAAMSSTAAASGVVLFLLSLPVVQGLKDWSVTYSPTQICALKGSTVTIGCSFKYPSSENGHITTVNKKVWFTNGNDYDPDDLETDSAYAGRVKYSPYRWKCNLMIRDLRESDSAVYKFRFETNQEGGSYTGLPGVTLTVRALQVHVDTSYYNRVKLTCQSSCQLRNRPSYIWYKNGVKISSQTNMYWNLYHWNPSDSFSCATSGHEALPSPSVYAPKVVSAVANYSGEIVEGSSVTLTCSSDANPAAKYTWYKEQTVLSRQQQVFIRSMNSSNSGEYHCTAENELGKSSSDCISVNVEYAPKLPFVSVSPSAEIVEGSSVTLTCSSDANPAAKYTWYKENKSLFHGPVGEYNFSVHSADSGNYFCKAENQHGQANSSSLFIDVQYAPKPPSVSVSPSGEIVEGNSVTLTCSSDANPAANYTWYKEGEDSPKASGQNFTITDARPEHSGSYYCVALNTRGRHNSTLPPINIASSVNSAAVGSITVLFLTLLILSAIIVIRKRRSLTQFFSRERPNRKVQQSVCPEYEDPSAAAQSVAAEQQHDLCYASVSFSKNQDDPVYSNIMPTKPSRQKEEDEEEAEYTLVKFSNGAQGLRGQQAVEDSSALYSTVNKNYRA